MIEDPSQSLTRPVMIDSIELFEQVDCVKIPPKSSDGVAEEVQTPFVQVSPVAHFPVYVP